MPCLMKHKLESRLLGEISITSGSQMTPPLWQKVKKNESLLMNVKEESEKNWLKIQHSKMKIMASGPITLWQINGQTVKIVADFILGGSKVTADGDCSHEIKRHLLLGLKVMTNVDSILKSIGITLPTKVRVVRLFFFPGVRYGCESWSVKIAERQIVDAFELWVWRRLYESLGCKEIQPAHPKEDQSWVFIGRVDVKAETPILWPPDAKN